LMRQTQCLVVPSLCYENQPTVILEAQQVGLPVIASNIGGIPEMIDEKFLFKAGDRESLKNKMKWARDNYNNIKNNIKIEKLDFLFVQNYIDRLLAL